MREAGSFTHSVCRVHGKDITYAYKISRTYKKDVHGMTARHVHPEPPDIPLPGRRREDRWSEGSGKRGPGGGEEGHLRRLRT